MFVMIKEKKQANRNKFHNKPLLFLITFIPRDIFSFSSETKCFQFDYDFISTQATFNLQRKINEYHEIICRMYKKCYCINLSSWILICNTRHNHNNSMTNWATIIWWSIFGLVSIIIPLYFVTNFITQFLTIEFFKAHDYIIY